MKIPWCAHDLSALGETMPPPASEADPSMTVSASASDSATTAVHLGLEKRDALECGRTQTLLSAGGDQDRIRGIHGLLHLHDVVGTSKPEGVDLKPSGPAGSPPPLKRAPGGGEARTFPRGSLVT